MNKTKYMISINARDIVVGLLDKETAEEDINLAHNLFDSHVNYNYYCGVVNFNTLKKFYRFLINKHFLMLWQPNKTFREVLREASNMARNTINNNVQFRNFMPQIYQHEKTYHVYKYQPQK